MTTASRKTIVAAGLLGIVGVALGAAGAHGRLHDALVARETLDYWRTAVQYHLIHAVALLALGAWRSARAGTSGGAKLAAVCWAAGIALFSGSLYALSLGGPRFLGPLTPVGGIFLIAGWALVAGTSWRKLES